jgi:hypothetical protein
MKINFEKIVTLSSLISVFATQSTLNFSIYQNSLESDGSLMQGIGNYFDKEEQCFFEYSNLPFNNKSDTTCEKKSDQTIKWISIMNTLLINEEIDLDSINPCKNFIENIRCLDNYSDFLVTLSNSEQDNIIKSMVMFLSNLDFKFINGFEEKFIVEILSKDNLVLQEFALNTLLVWNNISNIRLIENIKIKNFYLNNDLQEFVSERS